MVHAKSVHWQLDLIQIRKLAPLNFVIADPF